MKNIRWLCFFLSLNCLVFAKEIPESSSPPPSNLLSPFPEIAQGDRITPRYRSRQNKQQIGMIQQNKTCAMATSNLCPRPLTLDLTSHLQIGANYTYASISPHGSHSFSGSIGGLQALYEFKTWDRIYGGLQFFWRQGTTRGHHHKRTILDIKLEERIGYTFGSKKDDWILSLFSGFGYRHLGESVPVITTNFILDEEGDSSVHFYYNEFYLPLGVLTDWIIDDWVYLGLNVTWMPQVYPTVLISPLKGARWVIKERLANFLVEVPLTFLVSRKYNCTLILKPFFEYWQDGQTTAKTVTGNTLGLPGNTYLFGGAEFNFSYSF